MSTIPKNKFTAKLLSVMFALMIMFTTQGALSAYADVSPEASFSEFGLNADSSVRATWDQAGQKLAITGTGKIEGNKWIELAQKFDAKNFTKDHRGFGLNSDFTLEFGSGVRLPDITPLSIESERQGFFEKFQGAIHFPSDFDTSNVTDMSLMFRKTAKADPDVSNWNVSNVTKMSFMFTETAKADPDVSKWDVSNVTTMGGMFGSAQQADPNVSNWDVSNVWNMMQMFQRAEKANPGVSEWDVSNVTTMDGMFDSAQQANPNVSKWDVSNVKSMEGMFSNTEQANPDVSKWDVSNVKNMKWMFGNSKKAKPDLREWRPKNLQTIKGMFKNAEAAEEIDLNFYDLFDVDATNAFDNIKRLRKLSFFNLTNASIVFDGKFEYRESSEFIFSPGTPNVRIPFEPNRFYVVEVKEPADAVDVQVQFVEEGNLITSWNFKSSKDTEYSDKDLLYRSSAKADDLREYILVHPINRNKVDSSDAAFTVEVKKAPFLYTIDVSGGSADKDRAVQEEWVDITADTPPSGQKFVGWTSDKEVQFGSALANSTSFPMPPEDVRITANYAPTDQAIVSFDSRGGSSVLPIEVESGNPISEPIEPTRARHNFKGWYVSSSTPWDFNDPVNSDMTLYAHWDAPHESKVIFHSMGGSRVETLVVINSQERINEPTPTMEGHILAGWSTVPGGFVKFNFSDRVTLNPLKLYARWNPSPRYTVTFDSVGGSGVPSESVLPNTAAAQPSAPTKAGHPFEGWYTDTSYTSKWDFSNLINKDMTLYAKWGGGSSSGGGSTDGGHRAAVRPDAAGITIKDDKTPLAEADKVLAILKIGALKYQVFFENKLVDKMMDVAPMLHQGRTMLPARVIAELLGIEVKFDDSSKTATFVFESKDGDKKIENVIELQLGKAMMKVNGKEQPLSASILNVGGRILMPMTDVQKALKELGLKVDVKWEHLTKEVKLMEVK
ncbi:MAG: BspA family leucine-rich repeat surface protein [Peptostreptococcaceae bacterium]|nr:BspA family leucine-rich repeat surface protein [Peptostreptococcaceae bacterium]